MTRLDNRWFKDLKDKEAREKTQARIINTITSDPTIKKLVEIIDEELHQLERHQTNVEMYDNPSWSHVQAHYNGQTSALLSIRKLLTNE